MAPHSSILAWKIPWTEEPGGLQSMGSLGVRHDWATSLSLFTFMHWRRKWQPTPVFLPGESQGRGSLVGCCLWVTQSRTQVKRLSSSSMVGDTYQHILKTGFLVDHIVWRQNNQLITKVRRFHIQPFFLVNASLKLSFLEEIIFEEERSVVWKDEMKYSSSYVIATSCSVNQKI